MVFILVALDNLRDSRGPRALKGQWSADRSAALTVTFEMDVERGRILNPDLDNRHFEGFPDSESEMKELDSKAV